MRVESAALKIGTTVLDGYCLHACLWVIAFEQGLLPKRHEIEMTRQDWHAVWHNIGVTEGFMTDTKEFLDREQALQLAIDNEQVTVGNTVCRYELHAPDIM